MKKETMYKKHAIKDISVSKNTSYGFIGTNNDYMKLYYNNELIYYINTKSLGLDIYGNKLKKRCQNEYR